MSFEEKKKHFALFGNQWRRQDFVSGGTASHTIFKMKTHDSLKNYRYRILTKSSADADKPARRVWRPVKVAKHGTFYMLGLWLPTCVL